MCINSSDYLKYIFKKINFQKYIKIHMKEKNRILNQIEIYKFLFFFFYCTILYNK